MDHVERATDHLEVSLAAVAKTSEMVKEDAFFEGMNVVVPACMFPFRNKPRFILVICPKAKEDSKSCYAVLNKELAKEVARQLFECIETIEKLEAKEK